MYKSEAKNTIPVSQTKLIETLVVWIWSVFFGLLSSLYRLLYLGSQKNSKNIVLWDQRYSTPSFSQKELQQSERRVLFFCSSAGEYEQALPIIERLNPCKDLCHVIFFSPSGLKFHQSRKDQTSVSLAPPDTIWNWKNLIANFSPTHVIVIRHELWPAFLYCCKQLKAKRFLVNAPAHGGKSSRWLHKLVFSRFFNAIAYSPPASRAPLVANKKEAKFFFGSTKIDRVIDRSKMFEKSLEPYLKQQPETSRLIIGSGWPKDVDICLEALKIIKKTHTSIQVWIIPHDFSAVNFEYVNQQTKSLGLSFKYIDATQTSTEDYFKILSEAMPEEVVLIHAMGKLFPSYAYGNLAFIGGGLHHRVHNPLEAVAWGIPTAFGPNIDCCEEAVELVEEKLATICRQPIDVSNWWDKTMQDERLLANNTRSYLNARSGAADKIKTHFLE